MRILRTTLWGVHYFDPQKAGNFYSGSIELWNSYSFTPLQHAMEGRHLRNGQKFPTPPTCPGPQWLNSLSYCHPTSITRTPQKHLMGTDIWYPTSLNYTDTLKASFPEVGITAYTKDALLKIIYNRLSLAVLKISSLCTHISFHIPYNIFI